MLLSITIVNGILAVFAFVGNICAFVTYMKSKKLRTTANFFLIGLTVVDSSLGVFTAFSVATSIVGYRYYSDALCKCLAGLRASSAFFCLDFIAATAAVRYLLVVHPGRAKQLLNWRNCVLALIGLLVHNLLLVVPGWAGWTGVVFLKQFSACSIDWALDWFAVYLFALTLIPYVVIVYAYVCIYRAYRLSKRRVAVHATAAATTSGEGRAAAGLKKQELRMILQLLVIIIVYNVTFTTMSAMILLLDTSKDNATNDVLIGLCMVMFCTSAALDPPVYLFFNGYFRNQFISLFLPCLKKRGGQGEGPDTTLNRSSET